MPLLQAGERLFRHAQERNKRVKAARAQADKQYTFKPHINKRRTAAQPAVRVCARSGHREMPVLTCVHRCPPACLPACCCHQADGSRFDRLYKQGIKARQKREQLAAAKDKDLTFSPSINKRPSRGAQPAGATRFEHLFKDAAKRREAAKQREVDPSKVHSFSPEITKRAKRLKTKTKSRSDLLYQQALEQAARHKKQVQEAQKPAHSFKPKIHGYRSASTPRLRPGARAKADPEAFAARQRAEAEARQARLAAKAKERQATLAAELTFKPRLSRKSSRMANRGSEPVHERLHAESLAIAERRAAKQKEQELAAKPKRKPRRSTADASGYARPLWPPSPLGCRASLSLTPVL